MPPNPEQQLDDDADWQDRCRLVIAQRVNSGNGSNRKSEVNIHSPNPTPYTSVIEANGWQMSSTGEVILVATTPNPTVQNRLSLPVACQGRQ